MLAITFDDGIEAHYDIAMPILEKYGIKGTFFITINRVGTPGRLSWKQIKEMRQRGMEIGNHTMTHAHLGKTLISTKNLNPELDKNKIMMIEEKNRKLMLHELIEPIKIFEEHGISVRTLAFAGNSRPPEAIKLVMDNKMFPRIFETGYYSKDDENSHADKLRKIQEKGNCTILMIHGVAEGTGGWSPLRSREFFEQIIADFAKHRDHLHIDTMAEISSYRERAANSILTKLNDHEYRLDLKNPNTISGAGKLSLSINAPYQIFINGQKLPSHTKYFNAKTGDIIRLEPIAATVPKEN